jgi:hypothetical protein
MPPYRVTLARPISSDRTHNESDGYYLEIEFVIDGLTFQSQGRIWRRRSRLLYGEWARSLGALGRILEK